MCDAIQTRFYCWLQVSAAMKYCVAPGLAHTSGVRCRLLREMTRELRVLVLALLPTLSRQPSLLAKKKQRMDWSSMMVSCWLLCASQPCSYTGSFNAMPHMTSCFLALCTILMGSLLTTIFFFLEP